MSDTVQVGKQGRIVIPAHIRAALGLEPGDEVSIWLEGKEIHLMRPEDAVEALRGYLTDVSDGRSLVDELIAERRAAAVAGD